jgi:hypothetical protein
VDPGFEAEAIKLLHIIADRGWPIILHPDAIHEIAAWRDFGKLLCIENMDKRKPIGRSAEELSKVFQELPRASFCLDLGHARQVDPTMSEAVAIISRFRRRLTQLHVSEVNAQSRHDPLTLQTILACQRVAQFIPEETPIILESRVGTADIESEVENAIRALKPVPALAFAGD